MSVTVRKQIIRSMVSYYQIAVFHPTNGLLLTLCFYNTMTVIILTLFLSNICIFFSFVTNVWVKLTF